MKIANIRTEQFRNLQTLDFSLSQEFVVIVGPNACGKTNFLESIFYASVLQAFPPGKSWELIAFGADYFRLELTTTEHALSYYYGRKAEKRFERAQSVDGARKTAAHVIGLLPTVSFLPQDLNLLQLSPALRREYLDEILLQTETEYETTLAEYARVITQRNELLNRIHFGQAQPAELEVWDGQAAQRGRAIMMARRKLTAQIAQSLEEEYARLTGSPRAVRFVYAPSFPMDDNFEERLRQRQKEDIASGRTSVGPHRDDWRIEDREGRNLSHFLSRGEQRSLIIALKLLELRFLKAALRTEPVILLDELLAELDRARQAQVLEHLPETAQKFLTTTELEQLPEHILAQAQVIDLGKQE